MHCLAGLDRLTSGQVFIGDTDLGALDDDDVTHLRRDRVGFIFQSFNLIPTLTASQNIRLPARIARADLDESWMDHVVGILGLGDRLTHRPTEMSGGQQQRVAAARALVRRPEIVFADEPSGNLDTVASSELLGFLRNAVDDFGQTIVMVTHDPTAAVYSDRVVFLRDGAPVGELFDPTVDSIFDELKAIET
jgi:putative ABC transport system ATP-binding protein